MTPPEVAVKFTKADFESDQDVRWCPGCGDYAILSSMQKVLPELGVPPHQVVFVSGIGCSSRFPYYMNTYGFHTIHGRAPAIATGLKAIRPELMVWVITGDGDGLSIGGNHLLHLCRRNVDVNVLLFNNEIYGLTKGQYSPTSHEGTVTKSSPFGSMDHPVNPAAFALGADVSWFARTVDRDLKHMQGVFKAAAQHRGTSFVEILQNCIVFNDGIYAPLYDPKTKLHHILYLQHGEPLVFGPEGEQRALVFDGCRLVVRPRSEVQEGAIVRHDETNKELAWMLAQLKDPVPVGVFYNQPRHVYEEDLLRQEEERITAEGTGDLERLLHTGVTWEVRG